MLRLFVDGVMDGSLSLPAGWSFGNSTRDYSIGSLSSTTGFYDGEIEGFRYLVGEALWTADFMPPTFEPGRADGLCLIMRDSEQTKAYYPIGSSWSNIMSDFTLDDFLSHGMYMSTINSLDAEQWQALADGDTLKVFILDEFTAALTKAVSKTVAANYWDKAIHRTDYDYSYISANEINVDYLTAGTFKLNL